MKLRRKHIVLFGVPVLVLAILCASLFWLGWTQSGLRWVAAQVQPLLGETVSYKNLQGQLAGPLQINGLQIDTSALSLNLEKAHVEWSPWRLLAGHLFISDLNARGLELTFKPGQENTSDTPFRLPERLNLPLKVTLQNANLDNAIVRLPGTTDALRIDTLRVAGAISSRELTLRHLSIRGPAVLVEGQAELATVMPYTGNVKLDWQWAWPFLQRDFPPLKGTVTATGTVNELGVALQVRGPGELNVEGQIKNLFEEASWRADLRLSGWQPAQFVKDAAFNKQLTLETELQLEGNFHQLTALGRAVAHNTDIGKVSAKLKIRLTAEKLAVTAQQLSSSALPTTAQLQGTLHFNEQLDFSVQGQWRDLAWPPQKTADNIISQQGELHISGNQQAIEFVVDATVAKAGNGTLHIDGDIDLTSQPQFTLQANWQNLAVPINNKILRSQSGQLALRGTPADYQLAGDFTAQYAGLPSAEIQLRAHGNKEALTVQRLAANWLQGRWQLQGQLNWAEALNWHAQLQLTEVSLAPLADKRWQGAVTATLNTSGHLGDDPRINVTLKKLAGTVNNAPLSGGGVIHWQPDDHLLQLDSVIISAGKNSVRASGQIGGAQSNLDWSFNVPNLAALLPRAEGSLKAQGRISGTLQTPQIEFSAQGRNLRWQSYTLKQLHANADISLIEEAHSSFKIEASGLQRPGLDITNLTLQGSGTVAAHDITLNVATPQGELMLALQGGYNNQQWQGFLQQSAITPKNEATWRLAEPAALQLSANQARLQPACWQQAPARLCLSAHWIQGQGWQAAIDLSHLPLKALSPWLPAGLQYAGRFDGQAQFSGGADELPEGKLTLTLEQGRVSQTVGGESVTLLAFDTGKLDATLTNNTLTTQLLFQLPQQGKLAATIKLDPALNAKPSEKRISGKVTVHTDNFALVPVLVPEIGRFSGELDAELTLGGTLAAPALNGELHFRNGTATLPLQGLVLENLHLDVTAQGDSLQLTGGAQSGPGAINWQLNLTRTNDGWQGRGSLTGERFQAVNSAQAWVLVSPDLELRIDNRDLYLTGSLTIPEAEITPRNLSNTVQVSPDQVIVGNETQEAEHNWQLHAEVRTVFGEDVHFEGFGLTADIEGAVTAIEQ
ncbi:MAG TPA: translocation/assembly module TamB domain-containing protein, partial [Gammaproteobacteria bacterium]|nr:translocation/assembly module TamB domain-containing protein [Gammaproteobacteria bacterium]